MLVDMNGALKEFRDVHRTFNPYSVTIFDISIYSSLLAAQVIIDRPLKGVEKLSCDWVAADRPRSSIRILVSILRRDELKSNPALNQQEGKTYERVVLCTIDTLLFHF